MRRVDGRNPHRKETPKDPVATPYTHANMTKEQEEMMFGSLTFWVWGDCHDFSDGVREKEGLLIIES